jgi:hypothetical protein
MIKKVLIFIIVFIVFYEIYILYLERPSEKLVKNNKSVELPKIKKNEQEIIPIENKSFSYINNEVSDNILEAKFEDNTELVENININPNMFGKPSKYEKNNIIIWTILDPKPWNKVIYKYNEKYPFYFYIKIKVPSLNDYSNWKEIISNLDFDPRSGEIIIPTEDEETALSIANLIISNFKGDISLENIISKNLIDISINKAKKYEVVKNKLIEQIMTNLNEKSKEPITDTETFTTDLAKTNDNFVAYEGTEYSFF